MTLLFKLRAFLFGVLSLLILQACDNSPQEHQIERVTGPIEVETMSLSAEPWVYHIESFGKLSVADTVIVGVESPGVINAVPVKEGQAIAAGALLFALDSRKQQLRFDKATAAVREAQSQLEQAQQSLTRFQSLRKTSAVSEEKLQEAQTSAAAATARLEQARAALAIARTELAEREVRSPVNGLIESETVESGQYVQPGEPLVVIQAEGALQVSGFVNEREVLQITPAQIAIVTVAGQDYSARVESIGRTANARTGNYEIKLRVADDAEELWEGMSARVSLPVSEPHPVIVIPRSAVVDRNRKRVVFVATKNQAEARFVHFGLPDGTDIPVVSGLKAGETLIVGPMDRITDGSAIKHTDSNEQKLTP